MSLTFRLNFGSFKFRGFDFGFVYRVVNYQIIEVQLLLTCFYDFYSVKKFFLTFRHLKKKFSCVYISRSGGHFGVIVDTIHNHGNV